MAAEVVELRPHGRLEPPSRDSALVTASIGPAGEAVAVWSSPGGRDELQPGGPFSALARPVPVEVGTYMPEWTGLQPLEAVSVAFPQVQPMPGGGVLLVAARCRRTPQGGEHNAVLYDGSGAVAATGVFGDGIAHVLATRTGQIWVGYFDEGVFGNLGWGGGRTPPVGQAGLVRFTPGLERAWEFTPPGGADWIADCYALNVDGESAWTSYYTEFPIVRVAPGTMTGWRCGRVAFALMVSRRRAAKVGGYQGARDRVVAGWLGEEAFEESGTYRLALPGGRRLPESARYVGRGAELHVLDGYDWYKLSLDDLPAPAG